MNAMLTLKVRIQKALKPTRLSNSIDGLSRSSYELPSDPFAYHVRFPLSAASPSSSLSSTSSPFWVLSTSAPSTPATTPREGTLCLPGDLPASTVLAAAPESTESLFGGMEYHGALQLSGIPSTRPPSLVVIRQGPFCRVPQVSRGPALEKKQRGEVGVFPQPAPDQTHRRRRVHALRAPRARAENTSGTTPLDSPACTTLVESTDGSPAIVVRSPTLQSINTIAAAAASRSEEVERRSSRTPSLYLEPPPRRSRRSRKVPKSAPIKAASVLLPPVSTRPATSPLDWIVPVLGGKVHDSAANGGRHPATVPLPTVWLRESQTTSPTSDALPTTPSLKPAKSLSTLGRLVKRFSRGSRNTEKENGPVTETHGHIKKVRITTADIRIVRRDQARPCELPRWV